VNIDLQKSFNIDAGINFYVYANNNPVNGNDPTGNVSIDMTTQVNIAGWLSNLGQQVGVFQAPVSSLGFGVAQSFPLFDGAENDGGFVFSGGAGGSVSNPLNSGNNLYGLGGISLSIGISPGSVKDLAGSNNVYSGTWAPVTGSVSVDSQTGSCSGMSLGIAAGYSAGAQQTLTGVYSINNGWIGYSNNSNSNTSSSSSGLANQISSQSAAASQEENSSAADGGFVLYPNMSNTNQLQSVYQKP